MQYSPSEALYGRRNGVKGSGAPKIEDFELKTAKLSL